MRHKDSRYGVSIGLIAGLLTISLLTLFTPTENKAVAQEDPTEAPPSEEAPTPTPIRMFEIQSTVALTADGDLKGDGIINPGDTVRYTTVVHNTGGTASGPVDIVIQYDPAFISGIATISTGGLGGQGQVIWNVTNLDPDQKTELSFAATLLGIFPQGRTQVTGAIFVKAGGTELARTNTPPIDVLGPNLRFAAPPSFEIVTDLAQNGQFDPGDTVRFTLSYSNTGGGPSQEASIVADYPDELTPQVVGNPDNAQDSGSAMTWLIGSVPADGVIRTVKFSVQLTNEFPSGTNVYDLPVAIRSGTTSLDEQIASVPISGPNLVASPSYKIISDADSDGLVDPGDLIEITIQYDNIGTETVNNIVLTSKFDPAQFEISQANQNGVIDWEQGLVTWTQPSAEAGASGEVTCQAQARSFSQGTVSLSIEVAINSDQTKQTRRQLQIATTAPTPEDGATPTPFSSEIRPAQGQGLLTSIAVAILVGVFLCFSLLALTYVASRVLPGTPEEREALDTEEERSANRRLVRELVEGIILTAILFSVMVLGLQNALDRNSINSIIAGIVGYVAGRVSSQK
ncbi:MAG: hypothetical protein JXB07_12780 [Anaerolineae bacterium]|nr:hypothetical protein [Anaerolineae bacterium]